MSDIEDLRKAVGAAAVVDAYMAKSYYTGGNVRAVWNVSIRDDAYQIWKILEKELTRREKEVRDD